MAAFMLAVTALFKQRCRFCNVLQCVVVLQCLVAYTKAIWLSTRL
jgi:hypothetical protein